MINLATSLFPAKMLPRFLFIAVILASAESTSVWAQKPFTWDTLETKLYSFCSNATGPLSDEALSALSKSKIMIHGMEEGALIEPAWENSETKVGLAAAQLKKLNPTQLQLYTVQNDFTRAVYASGAWFAKHPECVLRDKNNASISRDIFRSLRSTTSAELGPARLTLATVGSTASRRSAAAMRG
jgi:hypothetical protein